MRDCVIVVGTGRNTNIDLIAPAVKVFDKMGASPGETPKDYTEIKSEKELLNCFQNFFQDSGAAERVVKDAPTFDKVVKAIDALPEKKVYTGGNAALMGDRMARCESVNVERCEGHARMGACACT